MANRKSSPALVGTDPSYEKIGSILSVKNTSTLKRMEDVLSVLSKLDALEIFVLAKTGFRS
ncbi:MAG: hypothetical protein KGH88_10000, partial [Thaumarchaeota archaeon]|nr:hypothetical protein [Nitrososphaerota archaeon]